MKTVYTLPIHSFIDLITNSSSETFIEATVKTKKAVTDLVNILLRQGESDKKCDDIFEVSIIVPKGTYKSVVDDDDDDDETTKDIDAESKEGKKIISDRQDSEPYYTNVELRVKSKIDDPDTIKAAKIIEDFISTYEINEGAN